MRAEIRVAGFGGQGVITFGYVLAKAASIHDSKYALMTQSYGPEARGGACRSDIVISESVIDYPKLSNLDYFIAMSIDAYSQFKSSIKPGAKVILEEDLVQVTEKDQIPDVTYYRIPSVREAEALGNRLAANMVMLGAAQAVTMAVTVKSLENAIKERFPKYTELNTKALHRGIALAQAAMGEA